MSTKSTISYDGSYHLYRELFEESPDNIYFRKYYDRDDSDTVSVSIPWKACVELAEYVNKQLEHERKLKDPEWLKEQLKKEQETAESLKEENSFLYDLHRINADSLQDRLEAVLMEESKDTDE